MGTTNTNDKKHLVIVGGSFAGLVLIPKIKDQFNITLIEKKDHFEWICSLPQSLMDLDYFENHAVVMYKDMIERDEIFGENVQYLQAMLTQIVNSNTIKVKRTSEIEQGSSIEDVPEEPINYDYLVICTGTHYKMNENNVENLTNLFTLKQRRDFLNKYTEEIEKAESILVVGGGATGTECLGEIQTKYGNTKKYGLINSQDELLAPFPATLRTKALTHFESTNTEIYLGQRYDPNGEIAKQYDFTIMCVGLSNYTPYMDNDRFQDCKDARGRIYVNEYFQVCNQNPCIESSEELIEDYKVYNNIFSYGDACLTRMNEVKNVPAIRDTSYVVAHNLKQMIKDKPNLRSMPYAVDNLAGVYFSNWSGGMLINDFAIRLPCTLMAKKFVEGSLMCFYKNKCCGKTRYNFYNCNVNFTMCCINNLLCCCSCSSQKAKRERREHFRKIFSENDRKLN